MTTKVTVSELRTFRNDEDFGDEGMIELFWRFVELLENHFATTATDVDGAMHVELSGGQLGAATLVLDHDPLPGDQLTIRVDGGSRPFSQRLGMQDLIVFIEPASSSFSRFAAKISAVLKG